MRNLVISLAAVAALSTFALPAAAQQQSTVAAAPQSRATNDSGAARAPQARGSDRVVCMNVELSGSHVTRRVCRTEREWQARGELDAD
jgi:hypothetical protein